MTERRTPTGHQRSSAALSERQPAARRNILPWLAVVVIVALVTGTLWTRWSRPDTPTLETEIDGRLVVLPFVNATGDPAYDWVAVGLAEMVAGTLERTPGVEVVASERLRRVIKTRDLDTTDPLGRDHLRTLAMALGAELALEARFRYGSNRRDTPDAFAVDFQILDADGTRAEGSFKGQDFLEAADQLTSAVARALTSGRVPVSLTAVHSRDPFTDRLYAMGVQQLQTAGPEAATPYFDIALRARPSFLHAKWRLAECTESAGDLTRAGNLAREILDEARGRGEQAFQVLGFRTLARLAVQEERLDDAQENLSQAFSIVLGEEDPQDRAELMLELARLALVRAETGRAEELLIEILQVRQDQGDRLGELTAMLEIASLFRGQGDLDGARDLLLQAQPIAASLNDVWAEMRIVTSLGDVVCDQGQVEDCLDLLRRASTFYEHRGDRERQLAVAHRLADMQILSGDFSTAENEYRDVIDLAAELGQPEIEASANLRLTWLLLRQGYPRQARTHLDRTLVLDRYLGDDRVQLQVVIGWFAYEQGNYRLAVDTLRQSKRQAADRWPKWSEDYLKVFEEAEIAGLRLPLPGEDGYRSRP